MAEHTLGSEDDQRLAPQAARLAAEQVEILCGGGGLADVHVAFRSELHKPLDARAGMFRPLAFVTVGEQQDETRGEAPLILTGANELIDDNLRAVDEITELRFPKHKAFRIVSREAVLEAEAARFGERRIVNFAEGLDGRKMCQRQIFLLRLRVDQNGMPLAERAALGVLSCQANRIAFEHERTISEQLRISVIEGPFPLTHFHALIQQFHNFGMDMEPGGSAN